MIGTIDEAKRKAKQRPADTGSKADAETAAS
jgi:hypothetical protein